MTFNVKSLLTAGATLTPEQEAALFGSIRLRNGTLKATNHHRLDDLNALVMREWRRLDHKPHKIMDVGASSGTASLEWSDSLTCAGIDADIVATDLCIRASLARLVPSYDVLLDHDGRVLQHIVCDRPVRWYLNGPHDFLKAGGYVVVALNMVASALLLFTNARRRAKDVLLVSPHARNRARLSFIEDDVMAPNPDHLRGQFDAIRVSNLLLLKYFDTAHIRRALDNLKDRLAGVGSFLIVNRTIEDGTNHGTMFRVNEMAKFEVVARMQTGSEIEDIVLAI
jgi:hypothetical protein